MSEVRGGESAGGVWEGIAITLEGIRGGAAREMWVEGSIGKRQEKRGKAPRSDGRQRGTGPLRSEGVSSGNRRLRDCREVVNEIQASVDSLGSGDRGRSPENQEAAEKVWR